MADNARRSRSRHRRLIHERRPTTSPCSRTFARNSLVREMTFRWNFILDCISSLSWVFMQLGFYLLIFEHTREIGSGTGWEKWPFFVFLATTLFINSLVQAFFMTNMDEFSELDSHRRSRLRPAEADRHAVPDLAAEDRMVVAGELRVRRDPDGDLARALGLSADAWPDACSTLCSTRLRRRDVV